MAELMHISAKAMIIANARDLSGRQIALTVEHGIVTEVLTQRPPCTVRTIDARGATVFPALWDHHTHLRATAAWKHSLDVTGLRSERELLEALDTGAREVDQSGWLRVVGFDDETFGELSASRLDYLFPTDLPIRVQHRSGHAWILNSAGCSALHEATGKHIPESGILYDQDSLFAALPRTRDLGARTRSFVQDQISFGVLGATDMTPTMDQASARNLELAAGSDFALKFFGSSGQGFGQNGGGTKIFMAEHDLPGFDELEQRLATARPDPVAIHSVTAESLILAMSVLQTSAQPSDRIEHALLTPRDYPQYAATGFPDKNLRPSIGVNPGFIEKQGDRLLRDLSSEEKQDYQRLRTWHDAGFALYGGTDSPYGPASPWRCMEAAARRRTHQGQHLGTGEALTPEQAVALFTRSGLQAEGPDLAVFPGTSADFCLVAQPWEKLAGDLSAAAVTAVFEKGTLVKG